MKQLNAEIEAARAEIAALRARAEELARAEGELRQQAEEHQRQAGELELYKSLVNRALDGIAIADPEGNITFANAAFWAMCGFSEGSTGRTIADIYPPDVLRTAKEEYMPEAFTVGMWQGFLEAQRPDGTRWLQHASVFVTPDANGAPMGLAAIFRDVTAQREATREREAMQAEMIAVQQKNLRELGTPLIPIADAIVAMPLVGAIDRMRAQQILETLLDGITKQQAAVAILDITGVKVVDAEIAAALVRTARAASLLGAEVVLTGVGPRLAQTLVELEVELQGIATRGTFQAGIAWARTRVGRARAR